MSLFKTMIASLWFSSGILAFSKPLIVNEPSWSPYFFREKQELKGFAVDLISTCMQEVGQPFTFKQVPIKRAKVSMKSGLIDINIYSQKGDRSEWLYFSKVPLFTSHYRPIVKKGSKVTITKFSDFDNYRIGHHLGLSYSKRYADYLKQRAGINIDEVRDHDLNLKKLIHDRIDLYVYPVASAFARAEQLGWKDQLDYIDFKVKTSVYFLTLSKESKKVSHPETFVKNFDSCLNRLKSSGRYCAFAKKHHIPCES